MPRKKHVINIHTSTGTTAPVSSDLYLGEIAVQHTPDNPALWIKMGSGETSDVYEKFIGETEIIDIISNSEVNLGSGYTYSGIPYVNSSTTLADAYSALTSIVLENEAELDECLTGVSLNGVSGVVENKVAVLSYHELPEVTQDDDGKVLTVVDDEWSAVTPTVIYAGTQAPPSNLGNEGDVYLQSSPVIIYETDGTTGLLGHNQSSLDNNWQLEGLDLSSYSYLKCYFAAGSASGDARTPAVIVDVILDDAAVGPTGYIGSIQTCLPFNRNREYLVSCAVDTTKTKFQVIHQNTLWDVSTSDANNNGRYCYKIEAYI